MVVLVTGGAGYIGSVITEHLIYDGYKVVVVDNLQQGHVKAVHSDATFYHSDIGDHYSLSSIFKKHEIEIVIHLAAETSVPLSMVNPEKYFLNNISKALNLLEIMRGSGCNKIIFSSTASIFGKTNKSPITEDQTKKPINPYGESKLIFENILDWYHESHGLKFNSLRYFNAAGATKIFGESHHPETHLIPLIFDVILRNKDSITIFGDDYPTKDGTCVRDYIHVSDLANAHISSIKNLDDNSNSKYNLGNGVGFSVLDIIKACEAVTNEKVSCFSDHRRLGDPPELIASSKLALKELKWKPKFSSIEDIVKTAWDWKVKNPNGYN